MRAVAAARPLLATATALGLLGCDGGPLQAKLTPTFVAASGETMTGVAGAAVTVAGVDHPADSIGRVFLDAKPEPSTPIEVRAPGFLERRTTFGRRDASDRLTLWPIAGAGGLTEQFVREVVYTSSSVGVVNPTPGGESMFRWSPSIQQVRIVLLGPDDHPEYREFPPASLDLQRRAVADMNAAMNGAVVYGDPEPGGDVAAAATIRIRIWPESPTCVQFGSRALASVNARSITNGIVTFCNANNFSGGTPLHELGHTFGLRHSTDRLDLMNGTNRQTQVLSPREKTVMALMMQRGAGNRFPDDDSSAAQVAAASLSAPVEFVCD
jgi:hypothetical protein